MSAPVGDKPVIPALPARPASELDYATLRNEIKQLMSKYGYVARSGEGLKLAMDRGRRYFKASGSRF